MGNMKKQFTNNDYLMIIGIIVAIIAPCFTNEIRTLIMGKWQIIMFVLGVNALVLKCILIKIRWAREEYNETIRGLQKKIDALKQIKDNDDEALTDIISICTTIGKRKMDYLYNCIKENKLLEKRDLGLTDLEKKLFEKQSEKRQKEFTESLKSFE